MKIWNCYLPFQFLPQTYVTIYSICISNYIFHLQSFYLVRQPCATTTRMGTFPWANRAIVTGNVKVDTRDCRDAPRCWCSIEGRWGASSRPPRTVTYPRPHPTSRAICPTEGTSRKRRKRIFRPAFRHCQPAHCPYRFELAPEIRRSDIFFFFFSPFFFDRTLFDRWYLSFREMQHIFQRRDRRDFYFGVIFLFRFFFFSFRK